MAPSKDWLLDKILTLVFFVFLGAIMFYDVLEKYLPRKDDE